MKKNILTIATLAVLSTGVISANHHIVQYKHNFFATGNYFANGYKLLNSENKKITDSKVVNPMGATVGYLYSLNNVFSLGASVSFETGGKLFENRVFEVSKFDPRVSQDSSYKFDLQNSYNISAISNVNLYSVNHFQVFAFGGIGYRLQKAEINNPAVTIEVTTGGNYGPISEKQAAVFAKQGQSSVEKHVLPYIGGKDQFTYIGYRYLADKKDIALQYKDNLNSTTTTNVNTTTYHAGLGVNYSFTQNLGALLKVGYYGSYNTTVEGAKISNNSLGVNAGISFKL